MFGRQNPQYEKKGDQLPLDHMWQMEETYETSFGTSVNREDMLMNSTFCKIQPAIIDDILNQAFKDIQSMKDIRCEHHGLNVTSSKGLMTIPSAEQLKSFSLEELQHMSTFEVFKIGTYQSNSQEITQWKVSITWKNVDISNLNLDNTVFIERDSVTVYPDYMNKPRLGEKLNKEATILFQQCVSRDEFEKTIYALKQKEKQGIVKHVMADFDRLTFGYNVPHFTKYTITGERRYNF